MCSATSYTNGGPAQQVESHRLKRSVQPEVPSRTKIKELSKVETTYKRPTEPSPGLLSTHV
jgi:hypothetical protein